MTHGGATLRVASGLRSGFDHQQHRPETASKAVCGERVREQRYDRPDWPRCMDCVAVDGITVPAPAAVDGPPLSETELRLFDGNR